MEYDVDQEVTDYADNEGVRRCAKCNIQFASVRHKIADAFIMVSAA